MNVEELAEILEGRGIEFRLVGSSINLLYCPACESNEYKVYLYDVNSAVLGKCFKASCSEGYSSFKYLLRYGLSLEDVRAIHGEDALTSLKMLDPQYFADLANTAHPSKAVKVKVAPDLDISNFMKISQWEDHPAALYAKSRGAVPTFYDRIWINPGYQSVVFLLIENSILTGYQQRFINARSNKDKTRNSTGFSKTETILQFPHDTGDILICEGPFTALSAWHYGYYGICTFGASISEYQLKRIAELAKIHNRNIGVAFDRDEAGEKGFKIIKSYFKRQNKEIFRVVTDENHNDLNDAWKAGAKVSKKDDEEISEDALPEVNFWGVTNE